MLLREGHPFTRKRRNGKALLEALRELEFVAVRTHADTLRILQLLKLEDRLRLITEHFMVLPAIVKATDLAAVMPRNIARGFARGRLCDRRAGLSAARLQRLAALEQALRERSRPTAGCGR